jgi:flavorubredoxin
MLPFRAVIAKNLDKLAHFPVEMIAPSHGQIYSQPAWILEAYRDWVVHPPHNLVVLPFVSMHGSTRMMVDHLAAALIARDVRVELFNLAVEVLDPVLCKGLPDQAAFAALERLADTIAQRHRENGLQ